MAYTDTNFKTKKAAKEALAAAKARGEKGLPAHQPGPFPLKDGKGTLEGPHFPQPHTWYAQAVFEDGYVTSIK